MKYIYILLSLLGVLYSNNSFSFEPGVTFKFSDYNKDNCNNGTIHISLIVDEVKPDFNYTILNVVWNMGDGNVITNNSFNCDYEYLTSGNYNVSAQINFIVAGDNTTYTVNATNVQNNSNYIIVPILIMNLDLNILPTPIYFTNTPIKFEIYFLTQNQLNLDGTLYLYVDNVNISSYSSTQLNGLSNNTLTTNTNFYTAGQHTVEVVYYSKDRLCKISVSKQFEIISEPPPPQCSNCFTFRPQKNEVYWVSAWVKVNSPTPLLTYSDRGVSVEIKYNGSVSVVNLIPSGDIIEGWQRIAGKFTVPNETSITDILINLKNSNTNGWDVLFDDVRIHPFNASLKSYVYDETTFWLLAELDDNNYATIYEYDSEGQLLRIKKETEKGIMTIQESRSSNPKKQ
jgi:hypothetical protein